MYVRALAQPENVAVFCVLKGGGINGQVAFTVRESTLGNELGRLAGGRHHQLAVVDLFGFRALGEGGQLSLVVDFGQSPVPVILHVQKVVVGLDHLVARL